LVERDCAAGRGPREICHGRTGLSRGRWGWQLAGVRAGYQRLAKKTDNEAKGGGKAADRLTRPIKGLQNFEKTNPTLDRGHGKEESGLGAECLR
jgi:hypothetical protein